jgi:hypothetical protein
MSAYLPCNSAYPDLESSGGCAHAVPTRHSMPTLHYPHAPLPHLMFPRFAPDMPTGVPFCLLAKLAPLFLASVDQVPCQLSPSETWHGYGGYLSWVGAIPPAGDGVGLPGVDLSPTSFLYISSKVPSDLVHSLLQPVIDSPVDVLVEWFLFLP